MLGTGNFDAILGAVQIEVGSPCEAIELGVSMITPEANPLGFTGILGPIRIPCMQLSIPLLPDFSEKLFRDILPGCIEDWINDCSGQFKRFTPSDVWIIDSALKNFKTIEEANKYWSRAEPIPLIIIFGSYNRENRPMNAAILLLNPLINMEDAMAVGGTIIMRSDVFVDLFGPQGQKAPNLLNNYKRYKVISSGGRIVLEDDETPYYDLNISGGESEDDN